MVEEVVVYEEQDVFQVQVVEKCNQVMGLFYFIECFINDYGYMFLLQECEEMVQDVVIINEFFEGVIVDELIIIIFLFESIVYRIVEIMYVFMSDLFQGDVVFEE